MAHSDNHDGEDFLSGPVPLPDDEPTAAELAHARAFASLVDRALAGRAPAAMSADDGGGLPHAGSGAEWRRGSIDRALVEAATVIRAATGGLELPAARKSSLVEAALRQAIGEPPVVTAARIAPVVALSSRRRWLPWSIAATSTAIAAAAIVALWVRAPRPVPPMPTAAAAVPASWTSRPSDALIGPIAREHAGDASARIDTIFADRLDGYRERTYAHGGRP